MPDSAIIPYIVRRDETYDIMKEENVYFCEECEKTMPLNTGLVISCNKEMKKVPLSGCTKSGVSAEL